MLYVIFRRYLKVWNGELLYYKPEDTLVIETYSLIIHNIICACIIDVYAYIHVHIIIMTQIVSLTTYLP